MQNAAELVLHSYPAFSCIVLCGAAAAVAAVAVVVAGTGFENYQSVTLVGVAVKEVNTARKDTVAECAVVAAVAVVYSPVAA